MSVGSFTLFPHEVSAIVSLLEWRRGRRRICTDGSTFGEQLLSENLLCGGTHGSTSTLSTPHCPTSLGSGEHLLSENLISGTTHGSTSTPSMPHCSECLQSGEQMLLLENPLSGNTCETQSSAPKQELRDILLTWMFLVQLQSFRGITRELCQRIDLKGNHLLDTMTRLHSSELISFAESIPDAANECVVKYSGEVSDVREELLCGEFCAPRKLLKTIAKTICLDQSALKKFDGPTCGEKLAWHCKFFVIIMLPVLLVCTTLYFVLSPQVVHVLNNSTSAVTLLKPGIDWNTLLCSLVGTLSAVVSLLMKSQHAAATRANQRCEMASALAMIIVKLQNWFDQEEKNKLHDTEYHGEAAEMV